MDEEGRGLHLRPIKDLFGVERYLSPKKGKLLSERAALLGFFSKKTGISIGQVAFMVGHLKELRDLYYIKSDMEQAHQRGVPYAASFRACLKTD